MSFEIGDSVGTTRCANQNISIFSDGLSEGPEAFAIIMDFDFDNYDANPVVASVAIDDEDDGKSVLFITEVLICYINSFPPLQNSLKKQKP